MHAPQACVNVVTALRAVCSNVRYKRRVDEEIILAFGEHRTSSTSWLGFVRGESLSVEVHGLVLWSVIDAM